MILRIISLGVLALVLSGCKVDFEVPRSEVSVGVTCIDESCDTDVTKIEKIHYVHGGWFGPYPNFKHDLQLELNNNKVKATLATANCEIKGEIPIEAYKGLAIKVSTASVTRDHGPSFIDSGNKMITLYEAGTPTDYFFKPGDNSHGEPIFENPDIIEQRVLAIIEELEQNDLNCYDPVTHVSIIQPSEILFNASMVAPIMLTDVDLILVERELELDLNAMKLSVSNLGKVAYKGGSYLCSQSLEGYADTELARLAKELKLTRSTGTIQSPCVADLMEGVVPGKIRLKRKSGQIEEGYLYTCGNIRKVQNFGAFQNRLEAILKRESAICYRM